jgi:hypothetical protein
VGGAWEKRELNTEFLSENLKGGDHLEDFGVYLRTISKWMLKKYGGSMWTGFI